MTEKRTPNPLPELSEQDAELLSAYIDDMLPPIERADLESRLENEAFLRTELAAMQQTVAWVNQLPPLKAPRNFTITAEDVRVAEPPKKIVRPNFRWTLAGTAAAVLVIVIGFSFVVMQSSMTSGGASMQAESIALQSTSVAPASEADSVGRSGIEQRADLPTASPAPTNEPTSTSLTIGIGATAMPPMVVEISTETLEDEAESVEEEANQADFDDRDAQAAESQATAVQEAAETQVQAAQVQAQGVEDAATNTVNQQETAIELAAAQETQNAEALKLGDVQQTATALTSLFAASPTMEFAGNDGSVALAPPTQTAAMMASGGSSGEASEGTVDDSAADSATTVQSSVDTADIVAESTQEPAPAEAPASNLPNTGGQPDFMRLGKILLAWLIQFIVESVQ